MQTFLPLDKALMVLHSATRHLVLAINDERDAGHTTAALDIRLADNREQMRVILKQLRSRPREA